VIEVLRVNEYADALAFVLNDSRMVRSLRLWERANDTPRAAWPCEKLRK
jgi:hypothetical protein